MLKSTQRTIYYYDLVVEKSAIHAITPGIGALADVWEKAFTSTTFHNIRERGRVIYRVGDMSIDWTQGILKCLIRRTDITASDAAYSNMKNGAFRHIPKAEDEGGDTAAHLVISLLPEKDKVNTYLCFLEGVPAISHRFIQPLFNNAISAACKNTNVFEYDDASGAKNRDGKPKRHSFVPRITLRGHLSESAIQDLESGTVSRIELVKSRVGTQLGGDPYLQEKQYALHVNVEKNLPSEGRIQRLLSAMQSRKESFQKGRIIFKDGNKIGRSIEYDLDSGTPEQLSYIKCLTIEDITPPMAQSTEHFVAGFVATMEAKLVAERKC